MPGGEHTQRVAVLETRVDGLVLLFNSRFDAIEKALTANSKDTAATKKLLIGLLVSLLLCMVGVSLKGCVGM